MKSASFSFQPYPVRAIIKYSDPYSNTQSKLWTTKYETFAHLGDKEKHLGQQELQAIFDERNSAAHFPFINYSTQYGLSCFEGLKAMPHPDGSVALFRPDKNATRMYKSMTGLMMPALPQDCFLKTTRELLKRAVSLGFKPPYDPAWEENDFLTAKSIYIRPFTHSEAGLGLNISQNPWVIFYLSEVGQYFDVEEKPRLLVSTMSRATPNGTGWIKCAANYVASILAKKKAKDQGYSEALFLDSRTQSTIEECSSCNIFFVLHDATIVTPALQDTILAGITRDSIIELAREQGITVEERTITIEEVFDSAVECFATGTAVGVSHFGSISYKGNTHRFGDETIGPTSYQLQRTLKRVQYGITKDTHGWLQKI